MTFTLTFTLFLPTSFKDLTVLKETLDGSGHATGGRGRPLRARKAGFPAGADRTAVEAKEALGCHRNPCAGQRLQLGVGPLDGGRLCACVTALPVPGEARAACGRAETRHEDPSATPVQYRRGVPWRRTEGWSRTLPTAGPGRRARTA